MLIEDGSGSGRKAKVNASFRIETQSTTINEERSANDLGDAYNINTGNISLTAAGTMIYVKNNEDRDLVIETIVFAFGLGTQSDSGEITIVRNPTGGDLISDATAVDQNANRNFGSSKTLTVDAYKGKSGGTLTGGSNLALIYLNQSQRASVPINFVIPKGNSVGISIDPKLSSGSMKVYCALLVHVKETT